jgi:hypothetical protein
MNNRRRKTKNSDFDFALSCHYQGVEQLRPQRRERKPQGYYNERKLFAPMDRALKKQQKADKLRFRSDCANNCYELLCTFRKENTII